MLLTDVKPKQSVYMQAMGLSYQIINGNITSTVNT